MCSLLITVLLCVPFLTACSDRRLGETVTEETQVVTDENGTHVVTYRYVDATKARGVDAKSLLMILAAEAVMVGLGVFMYGRAKRIEDLKKRCTQEVSAVITEVLKSKNDRGIRRRYWQYSARYRFSYKGSVYESHNDIYGVRKEGIGEYIPFEGEKVSVWIDPSDPDFVYDELAEGSKKIYFFSMAVLWIGAVVILGIVIKTFI